MKKMLITAIVLLAIAAPTFALVNGDWSTGDETGWTRWQAPRGGPAWAVTNSGPTAPEGTGSMVTGDTSFGWFQRETNVTAGKQYQVLADWAGNIGGVGWAEVMFFAVSAGATDAEIGNTCDVGNAWQIAYKKDSWGMNPPTAWDWQAASLSPHPSGNGGFVTPGAGEILVVGLKVGAAGGSNLWTSWDNITVVPEPGSLLALGTGLVGMAGFVVRRRR